MATTCMRSKCALLFDAVHRISHMRPLTSQVIVVRHGSFFNKKDAEAVWDSVTGVSNQGQKRGRAGRGKLLRRVNLNVGQKMGRGESGLVFPGLTYFLTGKEKSDDLVIRRQEKIPQETDIDTKKVSKLQKNRIIYHTDPLDRGYTARTAAGKQIRPPESVGEYDFSDFKAYVIENKIVGNVTASQGKVIKHYVLVAVGNGKGLFGMAVGKGASLLMAKDSAKNKAMQQLMFIEIHNNHTPLHNFTEKFHRTSVIVKQAPEGEGLHCHQTLKILCQLIGIKDVYIQSEGKVKNYLNLCRAFISGILKTKNLQEISDELGHHVVEYCYEKGNYPFVVASPSENAKKTDFKKEDGFTFETYCYGGRLPLEKPSKRPFYWKLEGFQKRKAQNYKRRNQPRATINRMVLGLQPEYQKRYYKESSE